MSTSELPYHYESGTGHSIVVLHPVLNDSQWADIDRVGNEVCEKYDSSGMKSVMVDLSELNYMGSAMVALIVRLWKSVKEKKGKMVVVNKDEMVYEVLKLAGLHNVWVIVESREEGYSKLGVSGSRSVSSGEGGSSGKALIITGTVALIAAIVGLVMVKQGGGFLGSAKTAQMLNVACSLISLITGMMLIMKHSDVKQKAGIGIAGVGIIVLLAGIMMGSESSATPPAPSGEAPPANEVKAESASESTESKPAENKPAENKTEEKAEAPAEKKESQPAPTLGKKDK